MSDLKGILLGIGNPLLDISANVDQAFLDKYELKRANAVLAEPKHLAIYEELQKNYKVEYTAGGAAQNSIRGASWMLQSHPGSVGYIGCVGNDENGKEMKSAAESYGVTTHYLIDDTTHTGTCAVLITDKERSMVAFLGAAEKHKKEHLATPEVQFAMNQAKYFYMTGFFLTHSPDTLVSIGQHAVENNKTVLMNLSAPFLIDFFWEQMSRVLPYADVVFCNEVEAASLGKKMEWGDNLDEIAKKLVTFPKENAKRGRTVIFTQGAKQTIVVAADKDEKFSPIKCTEEELVDTNGAGDAFVGGFLSMYVQQKPIETCVKAGHYAAWECIRRSGATFPTKPNFQE